MEKAWRSVLARYGQKVELCRAEGRTSVKAFFQPVEEKTPGERATPLGRAPRGKYLYLGPAVEPLEDVEELLWKERVFVPIRHREMDLGEGTVYRWGIFVEQ